MDEWYTLTQTLTSLANCSFNQKYRMVHFHFIVRQRYSAFEARLSSVTNRQYTIYIYILSMIKVIHDDTVTFFETGISSLEQFFGKISFGWKKKKKKHRFTLCDRYFVLQGKGLLYFRVQKRKKKKRFLEIFLDPFVDVHTYIQREGRSDSSLTKKPDKRKYV